jgi:hypothetical protein
VSRPEGARGRGVGAWRAGLAPMLGKELRSRTRGWLGPLLLTGYALALAAAVAGELWLTVGRAQQITAAVGLQLFTLGAVTLVLLVAFIAPVLSAGGVSGERERRTYDLLFVTRASPGGIVLGKWLASVAYLLLLVVAALPALGVVFLVGGVPPATLAAVLAVAAGTALGYGALGLCLSALLRRTQAAVVASLILVFLLTFGTVVVASLAVPGGPLYGGPVPPPGSFFGPVPAVPGASPAAPPWYLFLSPLAALGAVLPPGGPGPAGQVPFVGALLAEVTRLLQPVPPAVAYKLGLAYARGVGPVAPGFPGGPQLPPPSGMAAWPAWARFALDQAVLLVVALAAAALAAGPLRPGAAWRARRRWRRFAAPQSPAAGGARGD